MTRTVAPSTVTNGRLSVVPGAVIVVATSHAAAPRGSRQKRSEVTVLSGPYHAMYAVPAASTATPGLCPAPMVNGVAARAAAGASKATAARTDAMATGGLGTRASYGGRRRRQRGRQRGRAQRAHQQGDGARGAGEDERGDGPGAVGQRAGARGAR